MTGPTTRIFGGRALSGPVSTADPAPAPATGGAISNTAARRLLGQGRIPDDELLALLQRQPSLSASIIDTFRFTGLKDLETSCPKSYALVRERMVARVGAGVVTGLYANDARIVRLLGWNTVVADKLTEFQNYYRATKQEAADRHVSDLIREYEWTYADLAGIYAESGEFGLQLREMLAQGRPEETVALLVAEADEKQAEQLRLDQLAAQAEKWLGRKVASKDGWIFDTDVHLAELLDPRQGFEDQAQAVAWARMSGKACGVARIAGRGYVFVLNRQYDRDDIFLVEQWEEARTEVVPAPSAPPDITLTTTDGYVLKAKGGRFFGGTQARNAEAHLAASEAILEQSGAGLGADQAVRLFRQLTLDLLLVNLSGAEQRLRDQLALIYGVPWDMIDKVRALQPGTWRRSLRPKPAAGGEIQESAAALRRFMIWTADFAASTDGRDLTETERFELEYTLEQIGRIHAESPLAAMLVVNNRDPDAKGPAEEDDFEDKTAAGGPEQAAHTAAGELWTRLDNIDTVRRHFLREPDAVLDLEPLHDQILDGFDTYQRFWIGLATAQHGMSSLAKAVGMTALQLGLVVTGFFTAGLTSLALGGAATVLGARDVNEAFGEARLLGAMSKLDLKGGFQLATPDQAASARTWAYIGLGLAMLDVGGFVAAGRLVTRLSKAAAMPDVAGLLAQAGHDLPAIARKLNMPERTLVRQLETLTGAPREALLNRISQFVDINLSPAAFSPTVNWQPNADGAVRTIDEAVALAREQGVHIPDDIRIGAVAQKHIQKGAVAEYAQLGKYKNLPADAFIEWEQLYTSAGKIPVRISRDILNSDEAIVAVIAHEMHELNGLRALFEANDDRMTVGEFFRLIEPHHTKGNLHYDAWDIADDLVKKMRGENPPPRGRK